MKYTYVLRHIKYFLHAAWLKFILAIIKTLVITPEAPNNNLFKQQEIIGLLKYSSGDSPVCIVSHIVYNQSAPTVK